MHGAVCHTFNYLSNEIQMKAKFIMWMLYGLTYICDVYMKIYLFIYFVFFKKKKRMATNKECTDR